MDSFAKNLTFQEDQISSIKSSANPYVEWLIQGLISRVKMGTQEYRVHQGGVTPVIVPDPSPPKPADEDSESDIDGEMMLFPWEDE